jgi:hypothetical protein
MRRSAKECGRKTAAADEYGFLPPLARSTQTRRARAGPRPDGVLVLGRFMLRRCFSDLILSCLFKGSGFANTLALHPLCHPTHKCPGDTVFAQAGLPSSGASPGGTAPPDLPYTGPCVVAHPSADGMRGLSVSRRWAPQHVRSSATATLDRGADGPQRPGGGRGACALARVSRAAERLAGRRPRPCGLSSLPWCGATLSHLPGGSVTPTTSGCYR